MKNIQKNEKVLIQNNINDIFYKILNKKMVVFRSCPRCGINSVSKTAYITHLNRKTLCKSSVSDDNLQDEYIKFNITDKINDTLNGKLNVIDTQINNRNKKNKNDKNNRDQNYKNYKNNNIKVKDEESDEEDSSYTGSELSIGDSDEENSDIEDECGDKEKELINEIIDDQSEPEPEPDLDDYGDELTKEQQKKLEKMRHIERAIRNKCRRTKIRKERKLRKQKAENDLIKKTQEANKSVCKKMRDEMFPNGYKEKTDDEINTQCVDLDNIMCKICTKTYNIKEKYEEHCKKCSGIKYKNNDTNKYYISIIDSLLNVISNRNENIKILEKRNQYLEKSAYMLSNTNELNLTKERDIVILTKEDINPKAVNKELITKILEDRYVCEDNEHSDSMCYIYIPNVFDKYMIMYDCNNWVMKKIDDYKYLNECAEKGRIIKFKLKEWIVQRRFCKKFGDSFDAFLMDMKDDEEIIQIIKVHLMQMIRFIDNKFKEDIKKTVLNSLSNGTLISNSNSNNSNGNTTSTGNNSENNNTTINIDANALLSAIMGTNIK